MRKHLWLVMSMVLTILFVYWAGVTILVSVYGGEVNAYADPEKTINTSVGQEFTIGLHVVPRLGSNWIESHDDNMLTLVGDSYIPDDVTKLGYSGIQYSRYKVLKAGKTEIIVTYKHGATELVRGQKVFNVDIK